MYLFYTIIRKEKRQACLVSLDCSRICASLGVFQVTNATLRLCFFFSSLYFLQTVSRKRFSAPSLVKRRIIAKTFCETASLVQFPGTSSMQLAPVVQKVDSAIHRINQHPLDSAMVIFLTFIGWTVFFLVHYAIHLLYNSGQYSNRSWAMTNHSARSIHIIV